jgi:hypothetical protein
MSMPKCTKWYTQSSGHKINVGLYTTPVQYPTCRTHPFSFIQIQPNTEAYIYLGCRTSLRPLLSGICYGSTLSQLPP